MTDETPRIIEPEAIAAARGRLEAAIRRTKPKHIFPITREDAEVLLSCAARDRQLAVMVEALRPFAEISKYAAGKDDDPWCGQAPAVIRYRDLRAAYAALHPEGREGWDAHAAIMAAITFGATCPH